VNSLPGISSAPSLGMAYWLSPDWCCVLRQPRLFSLAHCGAANKLDAADQGVSSGHSFIEDTVEPSFSRDYLHVYHVRRNCLK